MKIILTGGHLTPAYAFAEVAHQKGDELLAIGSSGSNSPECQELSRLGVKYHTIKSVKYDRYHKLKSIITLPGIVRSIWQASKVIKEFRPDIIITFGSFNAVPVAFAAKMAKIPYLTHEQTKSIGLANKIIAPMATSCTVSYPESLSFFPRAKTLVIGNLLRQAVWQPPMFSELKLPSHLPILYITGGNQGSETIVKAILSILDQLTDKYQVVLQHGNINPFLNDQILPLVIAKPWFNVHESSWLLHHSHLIISRGGANTVAEIMVSGVPPIIIPLSGSANDEQAANAKFFEDHQAGVVLSQNNLSGRKLLESISLIESNYDTYQEHARQLEKFQHRDAAISLYQIAATAHQLV